MEIKRLLIVYNSTKKGALAMVEEIKAYFPDCLISTFTIAQLRKEDPRLCVDLAFSIGGDGTVLSCCRALSDCIHTPIIAINLGTFGYITEVQTSNWKDIYQKFAEGSIGVSQRMMLTGEIKRKGHEEYEVFSDALNDFVISSSGITKIVRLDMFVDGSYGGGIRADGVIVASPTGSTAYSLAAGGPILEPSMNAMIINPICAFSLSNRPIVISGNSVVEFEVLEGSKVGLALLADGQVTCEISQGDMVRISIRKKALLVNSQQRSFFDVLREKLHWDGGVNA